MNTSTEKRIEFLKTVASTLVPERFTARTISAIARAGSSKRCRVTSAGHGYRVGTIAYISGATEPEFNGTFLVVAAADDTFDIQVTGTSATASGTVVCYADIWVRQASIRGQKAAQTANVGKVRIGTKSADSGPAWPIFSDESTSIPFPNDGATRLNLGDWWIDVETNGDGIYVFYS